MLVFVQETQQSVFPLVVTIDDSSHVSDHCQRIVQLARRFHIEDFMVSSIRAGDNS